MQYFLDLCYNSFTRKKIETEKPKSPRNIFSNSLLLFDCCNLVCINTTTKLKDWKHVKYNKRRYYFCSDGCWNEWLSSPNQLGCWSPPLIPKSQLEEIEFLELNGQSTMLSNAGSDL